MQSSTMVQTTKMRLPESFLWKDRTPKQQSGCLGEPYHSRCASKYAWYPKGLLERFWEEKVDCIISNFYRKNDCYILNQGREESLEWNLWLLCSTQSPEQAYPTIVFSSSSLSTAKKARDEIRAYPAYQQLKIDFATAYEQIELEFVMRLSRPATGKEYRIPATQDQKSDATRQERQAHYDQGAMQDEIADPRSPRHDEQSYYQNEPLRDDRPRERFDISPPQTLTSYTLPAYPELTGRTRKYGLNEVQFELIRTGAKDLELTRSFIKANPKYMDVELKDFRRAAKEALKNGDEGFALRCIETMQLLQYCKHNQTSRASALRHIRRLHDSQLENGKEWQNFQQAVSHGWQVFSHQHTASSSLRHPSKRDMSTLQTPRKPTQDDIFEQSGQNQPYGSHPLFDVPDAQPLVSFPNSMSEETPRMSFNRGRAIPNLSSAEVSITPRARYELPEPTAQHEEVVTNFGRQLPAMPLRLNSMRENERDTPSRQQESLQNHERTFVDSPRRRALAVPRSPTTEVRSRMALDGGTAILASTDSRDQSTATITWTLKINSQAYVLLPGHVCSPRAYRQFPLRQSSSAKGPLKLFIQSSNKYAEGTAGSQTALGELDTRSTPENRVSDSYICRDLDYALIRIASTRDVSSNQVKVSMNSIIRPRHLTFGKKRSNWKVIVVSAVSGIRTASVLSTSATLLLPGANKPQRVIHISCSLVPGDSGSLVLDAKDLGLVGMAFATRRGQNVAYVMPASAILESIKKVVGHGNVNFFPS